MVKFQLYLRKLQFKLLKYWYRLQLALAGFDDKQVSKSQFNCSLASGCRTVSNNGSGSGLAPAQNILAVQV